MKKYAVIGSPIAHSKSPVLHQAAIEAGELEATFEAIEVKPQDLESWVKNVLRPHYKGIAVTLPHKTEILKYIDAPSDLAIKIGAVNTLYFQEGVLVGTNTDGIGALRAIMDVIPHLEGKKVLILGAGGASRAIVFALQTAGSLCAIWNRTTAKAEALAEEFDIGFLEDLTPEAFALFDLVINTTSVGLKAWESVVPADFWKSHQTAFDVVYDPLETRFLSEAADQGCEIVTGDKMLVYQAIEQIKLWHQKDEVDVEILENAFFQEAL